MTLEGKISTEIGVHATAAKWFKLFATQLHDVQNLTDRVHGTKLHKGEDWHHGETIKHWTYTIDGKVTTCHEKIESIDEQNKTVTYKLFGENIDKEFKVFTLVFKASDKNNGGAIVTWTIEYVRIHDGVDPPYGYIEYLHKCTRDIDAHLLRA